MASINCVLLDASDCKVYISKEGVDSREVTVVVFEGKIDGQDAYKLNREVHRILPKWKTDIIMDLSNFSYTNSVGIAVLFSIFHYQQQNNRRVLIGGMKPFLRDVFELVYLPPEIIVFDSLEQAKQKLV